MKERADCAIEFDHHGPAFANDPPGELRRARERCPIAWSPAHHGFWLVSGYDEAYTVLHDDEAFASSPGVSIPPMPKKGPPIDVDPPSYRFYRRALAPMMSAQVMEGLVADVRSWTDEAIERVAGTGRADLVTDIGAPVPARATMQLLGLDMVNWERYAHVWHDIFTEPLNPQAWEGHRALRVEIRQTIAQKKANPGPDLLSGMWAKPLFTEVEPYVVDGFSPEEEGTDIAMTLLGGGVDTTTNAFAGAVVWLGEHPDARDRLRAEPELMATAVEEFLRYFSVAPALARTATRDLELYDHRISAGDRLLVAFMGANRDPRAFDEPDVLRMDRWPNRHMAFGVGLHRCLGSHMARMALPIMLTAVLDDLPDYRLIGPGLVPYQDRAQINGWSRVPCEFTPRARPVAPGAAASRSR